MPRPTHITRFINRNDPLLGSPWSTGLGAGGTNGISTLRPSSRPAKSRYRGVTLGLDQAARRTTYAVPGLLHLVEGQVRRRQRARPVHLPLRRDHRLDREYSYSDRDQRHRFNSFCLWNAPAGINVNVRYSYRSHQPRSICGPSSINSFCPPGATATNFTDRINRDGTVTRRNTGRKDNQFSSAELRVSRPFQVSVLEVEPILEVFNVFNNDNFLSPEVTNLVFNFDGTIRSGDGDPRQVQLGLRVSW